MAVSRHDPTNDDLHGSSPQDEPKHEESERYSTIEIDDLDVLESFLQEAAEHLEFVEQKVVMLEQHFSLESVDEIFRSLHTIKGTSAFFGDNPVTALSHALESLLGTVREDGFGIDTELADALLAGTDELSRMVADIAVAAASRASDQLPLTITIDIGKTEDLLRRIEGINRRNHRVSEQVARHQESESGVQYPVDGPIPEDLYASFTSETSDLLAEVESDLLAMEKEPGNMALVDRPFRHIHTIRGNAGFLGLSRVESICSQIEDVLGVLRGGEQAISGGMISALLRSIDSLKRLVVDSHGPDSSFGEPNSEDPADYKPLGQILVEMGLVDEDAVETALELQDRKLGEILVSSGAVSSGGVDEALDHQRKLQKAIGGSAPTGDRKVVRVDVGKLDRLFQLVGELIMAEAMVVSNPDLAGLELDQFQRSANYLGKIVRQMQEITMSVRMIPLEGLFNKMRRLVRDLTRKTGKPVAVHVRGQDTEMDRNVIEVLSDPLVHVIRNCIDHGIETAAQRAEEGKPPEGRVDLEARYEGSEIWIIIRDDGKGLDRDSIAAKAVGRGLATEEEVRDLPDHEIWDFLFHPGFTTRDVVSDVSGRGVGMDVVRRNIEQLRGHVDITTEPRRWTQIILKIPLTLAILDGVTARVEDTLFTLPLADIREFHKAAPESVKNTSGTGEVLELRDEIIPVVRLRDFYGSHGGNDHDRQDVFVVVQSGSGRAAVVVEEIVAYNQIVVRPLPAYLGQVRGVSGCSVLGDGTVSLIIDTRSLLRQWRRRAG
jgi:two-component system chemotaxis sensor kinase CheA